MHILKKYLSWIYFNEVKKTKIKNNSSPLMKINLRLTRNQLGTYATGLCCTKINQFQTNYYAGRFPLYKKDRQTYRYLYVMDDE